MKSNEFDKKEIQEYVDGILSPEKARRVEKIIAALPEAREYYLIQLRQNHLLKLWWRGAIN